MSMRGSFDVETGVEPPADMPNDKRTMRYVELLEELKSCMQRSRRRQIRKEIASLLASLGMPSDYRIEGNQRLSERTKARIQEAHAIANARAAAPPPMMK